MGTAPPDIRAARFPQDADTVRRLFGAYADSLGISLDFQDFDAELAGLPGDYLPPAGRLLLAWQDDEAIGCVALPYTFNPVPGALFMERDLTG